jgi:hypothetical protein
MQIVPVLLFIAQSKDFSRDSYDDLQATRLPLQSNNSGG